MFSYFLNRWIVSRKFEKVESGYIYRRRPDLPGIEITEGERQEVMREFRQRYWKSWLIFLGLFLLAATAIAIIAVTLDLNEEFLTITGYGLAIVMLIFILMEQRKWAALPERRFADRPRIEPEIAATGWLGRFRRLSQKRSWPVHLGLIAIYGAIAWLLVPPSAGVSIGHWFIFACFAVGLALSLYGVLLKVRQSE